MSLYVEKREEKSVNLSVSGDMAQLELSIAPLMPQGLHDVGSPYKWLRAFRPLLFQDKNQIQESPEAKVLPPHVIIQHLICGYAPPDLLLPHVYMKKTVPQYLVRRLC